MGHKNWKGTLDFQNTKFDYQLMIIIKVKENSKIPLEIFHFASLCCTFEVVSGWRKRE